MSLSEDRRLAENRRVKDALLKEDNQEWGNLFRLARKIARKISPEHEEDLAQEGVKALLTDSMKYVASYDPNRGVQFSTYAHKRMRGAMVTYMSLQQIIRRPQQDREILRIRDRLWTNSGVEPSSEQIAEELGDVTTQRVEGALEWATRIELSINIEESTDTNSTGVDPPDPGADPPSEVINQEDQQIIQRRLESSLFAVRMIRPEYAVVWMLSTFDSASDEEIAVCLNQMDVEMVKNRGASHGEIAQVLSESRNTVNQWMSRARKKLRDISTILAPPHAEPVEITSDETAVSIDDIQRWRQAYQVLTRYSSLCSVEQISHSTRLSEEIVQKWVKNADTVNNLLSVAHQRLRQIREIANAANEGGNTDA